MKTRKATSVYDGRHFKEVKTYKDYLKEYLEKTRPKLLEKVQ